MKKMIKAPAFWIIIVLVLFGIFILLFLGKEKKYGYLLLSNISSYKCTEKECNPIENEKIENDTKKGKFIVYQNFENQGKYKLNYINKWNFFDENDNWINLNGSFIAGSEDLLLEEKEYKTRKMTQDENIILENHLKENNIFSYTKLEQNEVLEYDFNKNGKIEKILLASNANNETEDEKLFSIVIQIINNKSSVLHIDIFNQFENYKIPSYSIKGIINLYHSKEDYLVLLKGYFSEVGKSSNFLYKVEKNKFKNLVETK